MPTPYPAVLETMVQASPPEVPRIDGDLLTDVAADGTAVTIEMGDITPWDSVLAVVLDNPASAEPPPPHPDNAIDASAASSAIAARLTMKFIPVVAP